MISLHLWRLWSQRMSNHQTAATNSSKSDWTFNKVLRHNAVSILFPIDLSKMMDRSGRKRGRWKTLDLEANPLYPFVGHTVSQERMELFTRSPMWLMRMDSNRLVIISRKQIMFQLLQLMQLSLFRCLKLEALPCCLLLDKFCCWQLSLNKQMIFIIKSFFTQLALIHSLISSKLPDML